MKLERTKNASKSALFGIILKVYQLLVPFIMRTVMIYLMGIEYLGLNGLFTSVLQVLNLAELGVGSAMIFSMYKPIAEDDAVRLCALVKLYRKYYMIIGGVIAFLGILVTPFIPHLIEGEVPSELNIYVLYFLNLGATVLSYWCFAYKNSLFQAHQRNDVISKISLITSTIQYVSQILVLAIFHNYYYYVIALLFSQFLTNVIVAICANKFYPDYKPKGELEEKEVAKINKKIKDVFTMKLGATIVNSADTIVISAFLGLSVLAMYQNYYFIMSAVMGILQVMIYACLAGIGNSMITDTLDKNYNDFKKLVFIFNWIVTICVCCFATVYQPFIELWVGAEYTFDYGVVILFCVYFYLLIMQQIIGLYKDAAGIWHQDRFRPLVVAMINLGLNIAFVKQLGIYAILLSTILSYILVSVPWMIINVFKYVFKRDKKEYLKLFLYNFTVCAIITTVIVLCCSVIKVDNLILSIIKNVIISVGVANLLMWLLNRKKTYYNDMLDYIDKMTKRKFHSFIIKFKTKKYQVISDRIRGE